MGVEEDEDEDEEEEDAVELVVVVVVVVADLEGLVWVFRGFLWCRLPLLNH